MYRLLCWVASFVLAFWPTQKLLAKPLDDSSVELEKKIFESELFIFLKNWLDALNAWLSETLGINLYAWLDWAWNLILAGGRLIAELTFLLLGRIRDFLSL